MQKWIREYYNKKDAKAKQFLQETADILKIRKTVVKARPNKKPR